MTVPRPMWIPATYEEVEDACNYHSKTENTYTEFKSTYAPGPRAREIAQDLAAMARFGGVIIVGVAENRQARADHIVPVDLPVMAARLNDAANLGCA